MKKAKRILMIALIFTIVFTSVVSAAVTENDITIWINGKEYIYDRVSLGSPFVSDGRTFLPVRATANGLNVSVEWVQKDKTVILDGNIKMTVGSNKILLPDGTTYEMDVPVFSKNDRVFLPIRFVSVLLNKNIDWNMNGGRLNVYISDKEITTESTVINLYKDLSADEELLAVLEQYPKENYNWISSTALLYDMQGAGGPSSRIQLFSLKEDGCYSLWVRNYEPEHREIVKAILKSIAGNDGLTIYNQFTDIWDRADQTAVDKEYKAGNTTWWVENQTSGAELFIK